MGLNAPKLDDRHFQDLVDEAKKRIPHYCKEWTDHNVSDPGITMIELFSWMTEVLLYRLNQVPDLHYIKFLEMLGITLQEPQPAKVPVTFWLSAPQPVPFIIPTMTEVASTQTETEPSIVFSTDSDLRIYPPELISVLSRVTSGRNEKKVMREHNLRRLETGFEGLDVFSPIPQVNDALYFGFENDLSHHVLGFEMSFDQAGGTGIDPTLPPYVWEATSGKSNQTWNPCEVEADTTKGMNTVGHIHIFLPEIGRYAVNEKELFWVRARVKEISTQEKQAGMQSYEKSPRLRQLSVAAWGGTIRATHSQLISNEILGRSEGSPGQRFQLQRTPLLKRQPEENLIVTVENENTKTWSEVTDFADSQSDSRHYTLDSVTGELRLGPAIRQPDGTIKLFGAVPPRGSILTFNRYRCGGGNIGNIQIGVLNTLKTAIPFIAQVVNREPASGGLDAESLELAKMRASAMLRSRDRAVSEDDYEFLARQAMPASIARVKCLQPRPEQGGTVVPGQVYVLVIPRILHPEGLLTPDQLIPKNEDIIGLTAYLDERRMLTTRLDIRPPAYHWVGVKAKLKEIPGMDQVIVKKEVLDRLYWFLNPLTGGPEGKGWPFGRNLFVSDVYQCLQGMKNVQFIRNVELYLSKPGGEKQGDAIEVVEVVAHGVIASGIHTVEFL